MPSHKAQRPESPQIPRSKRPGQQAAHSAPDRNGWMPIESAPKDGTTIDLWSDIGQCRLADCWWEAGRHAWRQWGIDLFGSPGAIAVEDRVSHWRPIVGPEI